MLNRKKAPKIKKNRSAPEDEKAARSKRSNSSQVGDELEEIIYSLVQREIRANRTCLKYECCKIFHKKGYFSKDRGADIIFDIAIEVFLPNEDVYSILVLIECKNYNHSVRVDDVEEFFGKVQQVAAAKAKAVLVTTSSFQSGARDYAASKGIGLARYFGNATFKWELRRSPSAGARIFNLDISLIDQALLQEDFSSPMYDLYLQTPTRITPSLRILFEDLVADTSLSPSARLLITNTTNHAVVEVPFIEKEELEGRAAEVLNQIEYRSGKVSLDSVCELEKKRVGLKVKIGAKLPKVNNPNGILGRITFEPLEIHVYALSQQNEGRMRFTLAHELAHHFLGHSAYLVREFCVEEDFSLNLSIDEENSAIARIEFQANYFASCLLMPRLHFIDSFFRFIQNLGLKYRGHGALYVDHQTCNQRNYETVMTHLSSLYGTSKSAAAVRLKGLGLLQDVRKK
jgi:hypothetical protein